jgi:hypothetical protein
MTSVVELLSPLHVFSSSAVRVYHICTAFTHVLLCSVSPHCCKSPFRLLLYAKQS